METKIVMAQKLFQKYQDRSLNEADTRHQLINKVIHDILSWPSEAVHCEEYIKPGYADYVLFKNDKKHLIIEAKKEGAYFEIPNSFNSKTDYDFIKVEQLLTDGPIKDAIEQVQQYCITEGISSACITNGHEWVFFKPFEYGKPWKKLDAFVIKSLKYFSTSYTHAVNNLSFSNITENASLKSLLAISSKHKEIFVPKTKMTNFNYPVDSNTYASYLTPIVDKYFGDISITDKDFMENCYVKERNDNSISDDLHILLQDSLSPYFLHYKIKQLQDDNKGGHLGEILLETSKSRVEKLITLYGGKGAGKSTFLRRLLLFNPPQHLKHFSRIAIVDLVDIPEDKALINNHIWTEIINQLDTDNFMSSDRTQLTKLFQKEYDLAIKQDLFNLDPNSDRYNEILNNLISSWKSNYELCSKALARYHNNSLKGVIISIDNTDQYSPNIQDYCFTVAKLISKELSCITIISMREERFFASNIHGTLDAFKVTGYHISSPNPQNVFLKRINYILKLLSIDKLRSVLMFDIEEKQIEDITTFIHLLSNQFKKPTSSLNKFLSSCSQGNIRLALLLFREFMLSGYTNIYEMVSKKFTVIRIHQVLKPVMIPSRYFYNENLSYIPNVLQIRSKDIGSHFTGLRLLRLLNQKFDKGADYYMDIVELYSYFADSFSMLDDLRYNLDIMLKHGIVESRNRLDSYDEAVDAIKITAFGVYFLTELHMHFTYLDLVCVDCGLFNEQIANSIIVSSNEELKLFLNYDKRGRLIKRISKVKKFISYLSKCEGEERDEYNLSREQSNFTDLISSAFKKEISGILRSAKICHPIEGDILVEI